MKDDHLLKYREIFIYGEIETELALSINKSLHLLDYKNSELPIFIYINSDGGNIYDGFSIIDCIRNCKSVIYTIVLGEACSMGAEILLAGDYRYASSNSTIMFHEVSMGLEGPRKEYQSLSKHINIQESKYIKSLSKRIKISIQKLKDIRNSGEYMIADKAKSLKLIDGIWDYKIKDLVYNYKE